MCLLLLGALSLSRSPSQRAYCQDGRYLVSVRYPGQWHDIRSFVQPDNPDVLAVYSRIGPDYWSLYDFVCRNIDYRRDIGEFWQTPSETLKGHGDCEDTSILLTSLLRNFSDAHVAIGSLQGWGHCFPGKTRIICLKEGRYSIQMIGDLGHQGNIQVLSYNFNRQRFEFKPIIGFEKQGTQDIVRVKLTNGTEFECTPDHLFFAANNQFSLPQHRQKYQTTQPIFHIKPIKEIKRSKYRLGSILAAREIPALNQLDVLTDELAIEGIYAAEGCCSNRGVKTNKAGDFPLRGRGLNNSSSRTRIVNTEPNIIAKITNNLNNLGASYAVHWHDGKQPQRKRLCTIEVFSPEIKETLINMGRGSRDMAFLPDRINGSREQITVLLDSYHLGDGHNLKNGADAYTTASTDLAKQLRLLHLIVGRPLYTQYRKPAKDGYSRNWRLYESGKSRFNTEILLGISRVGIRSLSESGVAEVYDIEVADNHNFILADSYVLAHNCWVNHEGKILESTFTSARPVPDPQDYCPYVYFNDQKVIELWPGALGEVFGLGRDEQSKLELIARALEAAV